MTIIIVMARSMASGMIVIGSAREISKRPTSEASNRAKNRARTTLATAPIAAIPVTEIAVTEPTAGTAVTTAEITAADRYSGLTRMVLTADIRKVTTGMSEIIGVILTIERTERSLEYRTKGRNKDEKKEGSGKRFLLFL
jgi:hypothetical protein